MHPAFDGRKWIKLSLLALFVLCAKVAFAADSRTALVSLDDDVTAFLSQSGKDQARFVNYVRLALADPQSANVTAAYKAAKQICGDCSWSWTKDEQYGWYIHISFDSGAELDEAQSARAMPPTEVKRTPVIKRN